MLAGIRTAVLGKVSELQPQDLSSCVLSLQANKANNGRIPSISTDVWKDMSKYGNNATLVNQAKNGTTSGFIISETINGKTIYQNRFDGTDDYSNIVATSSLDITTGAFAFGATFKIKTGSGNAYILSKNLADTTTLQYAILYKATSPNNTIQLLLNNTARYELPTNSISQNVWYNVIFHRDISGNITGYINKVASTTGVYVGNLVTQPHFFIGCRSNSADGSSRSAFIPMDLATLTMYWNSSGEIDIQKIIKAEMNVSFAYTGIK
jgi:hypothetical protein